MRISRKYLSNSLKAIFVLVLFLNFSFAATPAKAGVWGEAFAATILDQALNTIKRQLEGAILGTLKVAAISVLNSQVGQTFFIGSLLKKCGYK